MFDRKEKTEKQREKYEIISRSGGTMKEIKVKYLKSGMIAMESIYSPRKQLLVKQNTVLNTQMINQLEYYSVASIMIEEVTASQKLLISDKMQKMKETYSQKTCMSEEYQKFKELYMDKVSSLRNMLNDFIIKDGTLDTKALLEEMVSLCSAQTTAISMFNMLHNLRQIDDSTYAHCVNVAIISRMIGTWMDLSKDDLDILTLCGLLHDIGKAQIPQSIIGKPGRLTPEEFEEIKKHPKIGYELLKNHPINEHIKNAALMHHERCDGKGYPSSLTGKEIDDFASIVAIADVYDAMTADRCYRAGLCPFEVIAMFEQEGIEKYKSGFILTFLKRIAAAYINNDVLLSNGETGTIIMINQRLTRPVIQTHSNEFLDLEKCTDLYVQAII